MELNYFDIVVGSIILLLGLKGILNGFIKELFGLLGIVGGIFIASRYQVEIGTLISDTVFHFENKAALTFTGFLVTLASFWLSMILLGMVFKKLTHLSGLGIVDKIFGFIFGSGKFFLITAVIIVSLNNIKALQSSMQKFMDNSLLYPIFLEVGQELMNIDPSVLSNDLNSTLNSVKTNIQNKVEDTKADIIKEESQKVVEQVKSTINDMKGKGQ